MPNYAQAAISVRQKKERGLEKLHTGEKPHEVKTRSRRERQVEAAW